VVATPLGNLGDITRRALEVLASVRCIFSEEPQTTLRLLNHYGIANRVLPYREAGREGAARQVLGMLAEGSDVALVSEAGTPGISDPGRDLLQRCYQAGLPVSPVPGPSALCCALSVCGLPTRRLVFEGFLPRDPGPRRRLLAALAVEERSIVLFEGPHHLLDTLQDLLDALGDRPALLARELTKKFEELRQATLAEHLAAERGRKPRGEYVLVIQGAAPVSPGVPDLEEARRQARWLRDLGLGASQTAAVLTRFCGLSRREAYRLASMEG
jgi:16S rRNA (cytidine1402-2'-O)-methyltransferase